MSRLPAALIRNVLAIGPEVYLFRGSPGVIARARESFYLRRRIVYLLIFDVSRPSDHIRIIRATSPRVAFPIGAAPYVTSDVY